MLQMTDAMGLQGMINDLVQQSDFPTGDKLTNELDQLELKTNGSPESYQQLKIFRMLRQKLWRLSKKRIKQQHPVLGITGTGGSGKIISVDELVRRFN
jgi:methylmalonyl-CoA mutase